MPVTFQIIKNFFIDKEGYEKGEESFIVQNSVNNGSTPSTIFHLNIRLFLAVTFELVMCS